MALESILIHTCCADCFLNAHNYLVKENLIDDNTKIHLLYYNPNIHPRSEYSSRLEALKKVISDDMKLIIPDYKPKEYFEKIQGSENRCIACWECRIQNLFEYAKGNNILNITTTLLVSHYQETEVIKNIFKEKNKLYNLNFIEVTDKHNLKNNGFYKQNYCGCCFSLVEKMKQKYS